eukprot:TRINITY_DN25_c0_g2_i2.p1 TRINITY_DN25_c0_g2~~TRINITY_DN25_c0_g2_i2.p1  ORF type:complete len:422 (-),score=98.91 TRINITY_DN25_c0_g2_i2:73-1338(-)
MSDYFDEHACVERFKGFLRVPSVHPDPPYTLVRDYLKVQADYWGLPMKVHEFIPGKLIIVLTLEGEQPTLPSIALYSHSDVVPVVKDAWKFPPFDAHETEDGFIYARGAQDMKCVGMQQLEAVGRLKVRSDECGQKLNKRTIHVIFGPDEEIGGGPGMKVFASSEEFKEMNVGVFFDEGLASGLDVPEDSIPLFCGQRATWWVRITAHGPPGHGSMLIADTAASKLMRTVSRFQAWRDAEEKEYLENCKTHGHVVSQSLSTTVNINFMSAGRANEDGTFLPNVIPVIAEAGIDIRIPPNVDLGELLEKVEGWCKEDGTEISFQQFASTNMVTPIEPPDLYYEAIMETAKSKGVTLVPAIFPAGSDMRHVMTAYSGKIPCFGVSFMPATPVLLHDHNEYIKRDIYLRGVGFFEDLVKRVANA